MSGDSYTLEHIGGVPTAFRRALSIILPVLLLGALMVMVADRADASTASAGAAAVSTVSSVGAGQFTIEAIICPILLFLKAAFSSFFVSLFDNLLAAFGCAGVPSGVIVDDVDDDDDDGDDDDD